MLGAAVVGVLILTAISKLMRAGANARIRGLVLVLTLTVLFFSWSDASVAVLPGQFVQVTSKTDSLYFPDASPRPRLRLSPVAVRTAAAARTGTRRDRWRYRPPRRAARPAGTAGRNWARTGTSRP